MAPREQLSALVEQSPLSEVDQTLWKSILETLSDEHIQTILNFVGDDVDRMKLLHENFTKKRDALIAGDNAALDKIFEEEKQHVEDDK